MVERAYADRAEWFGDPAYVKVPVTGLTSKRYAETLFRSIDPERATPSQEVHAGEPLRYESPQTTHYSVVDAQGNAVSTTFKVRKESYGVGVERTYPIHSPLLEKIEVKKRGDVRRAKLFYLREVSGKKARIREITGLWDQYKSSRLTPDEQALARTFIDSRMAFVQDGLKPTMAALRGNDPEELKRLVA